MLITLYVAYARTLPLESVSHRLTYKSGLKANQLTRKTATHSGTIFEEDKQLTDEVTKLCHFPDPQSNKFSNFYNVLATMRALIPTTFNLKFKNPCWYSNFNIPPLKGNVNKFYNELVPLYNLVGLKSKTLHCLPYFYIAGFPRSGTTALYSLISHHPQFAKPAYKEIHWLTHSKFDSTFPNNLKSVMRCIYHFHHAAERIEQNADLVTCDASASTMWDVFFHSNQTSGCEVPLLLTYILPDVKYVVMLRNPMERLYSEFWYHCKSDHRLKQLRRNGPRIFHEAVEKSLNLFNSCQSHYSPLQCLLLWQKGIEKGICKFVKLHVSLYYLHIIKWFSVIPCKQFIIIKSEDLFHNPHEVLKKVFEFLDLPPISEDNLAKFTWNSNKNVYTEYYDQSMALLNETKILLGNFFQPYNHKLANLLQDKRFLWDYI